MLEEIKNLYLDRYIVWFIFQVPKSAASVEANSKAKDAVKDTKADVNAKKDTAKGSKTANAPEANKNIEKDSSQVFYIFLLLSTPKLLLVLCMYNYINYFVLI